MPCRGANQLEVDNALVFEEPTLSMLERIVRISGARGDCIRFGHGEAFPELPNFAETVLLAQAMSHIQRTPSRKQAVTMRFHIKFKDGRPDALVIYVAGLSVDEKTQEHVLTGARDAQGNASEDRYPVADVASIRFAGND